jgi:hypothetical protein
MGEFPITHAPPSLEQQKFIAQPPPSQWAVQRPPTHEDAAPEQTVHAPPMAPHAPGESPPMQVPASSQHPP